MTRLAILVIDNSVDDIELIRNAILELRPEAEFHAIADAEEAWTMLECLDHQLAPSLILLDLLMPRLNGLELLTRLHRLPSLRSTPVVALSSSSDPRDLDQARASGIPAYAKPATFGELCDLMKRIIGESAADSSR